MSDSPFDKETQRRDTESVSGDRLVYVMPEQPYGIALDGGISFSELWRIIWLKKYLIIAVTVFFALASVVYALLATEWFRAEAILMPAEEQSMPALGGLSGLAALAGVSVGGGSSIEAVATLKSRELAREFIEELGLLQVVFADDWNADLHRWSGADPEKWPDMRDAIKYFHDNLLDVREDRQTGLVTVAIEWTDPQVAARWVDILVHRLNAKLRKRSLHEAAANVEYLRTELSRTSVVMLQQSIAQLLESELQKLMLARGNEEFAFRVIDAASVPKRRERPKRALIVVLGSILGAAFAVFWVFAAHCKNSSRQAMPTSQFSA